MKEISICIPCYNEEECISKIYEELRAVFTGLPQYVFFVLFIDDGSNDNTLIQIKKLLERYGEEHIGYLSFARNFGKESAIYAGLESANGDYIVLMDADLQHPPSLLPKMIQLLEQGHDCVGAKRATRKGEPVVRSLLSKSFYSLVNHITSMKLVQGGSDYRIMTRQVAEAITSLHENERFIKGIFSWVGFDTVYIEYDNVNRYAGTTKWKLGGLFRYAIHGFISFATTPLRAAIWLGLLMMSVSVVYAIKLFYSMVTGIRVWTDTTTIIFLLILIGGVITVILGVVGEYMARIYLELKNRPIYILKESRIRSKNER